MRYWIKDEADTAQRFPLKQLFEALLERYGDNYRLLLSRAEGYGMQIDEWDDQLDDCDEIEIDPRIFERISLGTEEWFYNLDAEIRATGHKIKFGLHDSTALYVEALDDLTEFLRERFEFVQTS